MEIRHATKQDLSQIMEIYAYARRFMADHGNPNQWGPTNWPPEELICSNIASWLDDRPYGVIHRLAGNGAVNGIGSFCIRWAFEQCGHLRNNLCARRPLSKTGI